MAILRSLLVNLSMNSAQYRADLEKSKKKTNTDLKAMSASAADFGVKSAAAFAATATAMAVMNAKAVREMNNFAKLANTTVASMNSLQVAGASVGLTAEKMADQFKDVQEKLGEFTAEGTGTFNDFFNTMKMTTEEAERFAAAVDGMSGEQIIRAMVSQMQNAGKTANEMSYALEGVGSDLTQMLPLLLDNGKELDRMRERVKGVANALTAEDIANYTKLAGEVDVLDLSVSMFSNKLIAQVLPTMNELAEKTSDWINSLTKGIDESNLGAAKGELAHLGYELDDLKAKSELAAKAQQQLANKEYTSAYHAAALAKSAKNAGFYADEIERVQSEIVLANKEVEKLQAVFDKPLELTIKMPEKVKSFGELYGDTSNVDAYSLGVYKENQRIADAMAERLIISQMTAEEQYNADTKFLQDNLADHETYLAAKAALDKEYSDAQKTASMQAQAVIMGSQATQLDIMQQGLQGLMQYSEEGSAIAKAAFLASQAVAASQVMVSAEQAKWQAASTIPNAAAQAATMSTIDLQKYMSLGLIAAQTGAGAASIFHAGIDAIPDAATRTDNTILIEGGERVISKNHNQELMGIMRGLKGGNGGARGNVQVIVQGSIYGDEQTKKIISAAAAEGYSRVAQDAKTNGVIYKQMRR